MTLNVQGAELRSKLSFRVMSPLCRVLGVRLNMSYNLGYNMTQFTMPRVSFRLLLVFIFISIVLGMMGCQQQITIVPLSESTLALCEPGRGWETEAIRWSHGQAFNTTDSECI